MDKKSKKRIDVLRKRIIKLQQLLGAEKQQPDEPDEITRLENEIAACHAEIDKLKAG